MLRVRPRPLRVGSPAAED
ncbi:rCG22103, partial [Rattus norvegicus]